MKIRIYNTSLEELYTLARLALDMGFSANIRPDGMYCSGSIRTWAALCRWNAPVAEA